MIPHDLLAGTEPALLFAAAAILAFGAFVKGAVGFALPMIAVSGIGSFMSAQDTIALLLFPIVVSNLWQTLRQGLGPAVATGRQFWKLNLTMGMLIGLVAQAVPDIPSDALFVVLGLVVTVAAALNLAGWHPPAPRAPRALAMLEIATGVVAGIAGGLAGIWGPPVLFFLLALGTEKTALIRAQGLTFLVGSAILIPAHLASGLLDARTLPLSVLMVLPVVAGMALGLRMQDRMDTERFRRVTLVVLCLSGLNLLRRGLA